MTNHINDRVIVITGAASGFGRLVATKTAALGAKEVASDVNEADLTATVGAITDGGDTAMGVIADVTDREAMAALAATAVDTYGAIDVMVNNAGVMPLGFYADHAQAGDAWDHCIDINIKGVLNGIIAVHDQMITQGRGHIVNLSSIYGNYPVAGAAVYGATKAAVNVLSEALRQESQGRIKVTTIRPTGVPGTALGNGIVNPAAISGILGANQTAFMEAMGAVLGDNPPAGLGDPDSVEYFSLEPELLADQIVYAINQPWGVSIGDLTVRATGDRYII